ncbi:MAG: sigma 54-interacting transcriptional regulator [Candidatus Cloacimonadales bacterium]
MLYAKKNIEQILDRLPEAILVFDEKKIITYFNQKFLQLLALDAEAIEGKIINILFTRLQLTGIYAMFQRALDQKNAQSQICQIDNDSYLVSISKISEDFLVIFKDISEQKKLEKMMNKAINDLLMAKEYNKNLLDSSLDMIIAVDNQRRIITFNKAAQEKFGYKPEEIIGKHVKILYQNSQESLETHKEVISNGQSIREVTNIKKNGELFICSLATSEILDGQGKRIGVMGISRDISNQKKTEADLMILKKQLQSQEIKVAALGNSSAIRKVLKQVQMVAPTSMTVILQGASGTGKELIANLLHKHSNRSSAPLIAVDCGAIPDTLIESELFGHEKGAFTGADSKKSGVFERANGGTLLLDEITNLNLSAQIKLLRVLQERKYSRLGSSKSIKFDTRIIVASNIEINNAVQKGDFRLDLYHRLNEFQIKLPLLQERGEDIPILAKYFLRQANKDLNKSIKDFSSAAMKKIMSYEWPGNVREFRNIIRRATLLCEKSRIEAEHLMIDSSDASNISSNPQLLISGYGLKEITTRKTHNIEEELLIFALKKADGNKTKAAKLLKIERMTLYTKMRYYGLLD